MEVAPESEPKAFVPRVKELRVSNYRFAGEDVRVTFGDIAALVGPNGSGKSNVLDVFRFLREALTFGLEPAVSKRLGIAAAALLRPNRVQSILRWTLQVDTHRSATYTIQLNAAQNRSFRVEHEQLVLVDAGVLRNLLLLEGGRVKSAPPGLAPRETEVELALPALAGDADIRPVVEALRSIRVHSIYPRVLSEPQPIGVAPPLDDSGSNWCAVLKALGADSRKELKLGLERITGDITDFRVDSAGGYYTAEFEHRLEGGDRWFSAAQESDGTLRLAGILTALLQSPSPPMIGIEEPELTINPGLLALLYDYVKATSGRSQIASQLTARILLDMLNVNDIRVVQRRRGVSDVTPMAPSQLSMVRASLLTPGELLRSGGLQGEGQQTNFADLFAPDAPAH